MILGKVWDTMSHILSIFQFGKETAIKTSHNIQIKSQLIWFLDQPVFLLIDNNSDGNIIVQTNRNCDSENKNLKVMGFCWWWIVVVWLGCFFFCLGFFTFTFVVVVSSFLDYFVYSGEVFWLAIMPVSPQSAELHHTYI